MTAAAFVAPSSAAPLEPIRDDSVRQVVVLNAADPYLPAFVEIDSGVREAIKEGRGASVRLYAEALDMYRFPEAQIHENVLSLLRKKYGGLKVDVIVAAGDAALRFAQMHRSEIWPGATIVFHSVPEAEVHKEVLDSRTLGVPVRIDFGSTLDLALRLRPQTRRLVVVAGTSERDRAFLGLTRKAVEHYAGKLEVQYLTDVSVAESVAVVRTLPSDAVVLFTTMFRDGGGNPVVPRDVLTRIAAASTVPVFGIFETYLGDGIVAGAIATYKAHGRRAGQLVVRVLNGENPSAIGSQGPAEPHCIADWKQLHRWLIDEALLPEGCEVRYRTLTDWERYRWQILTALAVILLQTALIVALALSRSRLSRSQTELHEQHDQRAKAETIALQLRSRLVRFSRERSLGAMATAISHEINQPLIAIQNYAQAVRRRLQNEAGAQPKLIDLVAKIEGQAQRAGAITERIRSLVGADEPQLRPVAIFPLIDEVIRIMQPESSERGCDLVCEQATSIPAVLADALQVQLVLVNLLRNATQSVASIRGHDKRISIGVDRINDQEVQISVSDRGPGVPADRVADIFEPLYSNTARGMGIGLSIARAIIESHGGRLWYEPNPDGGAVFRFTLQVSDS